MFSDNLGGWVMKALAKIIIEKWFFPLGRFFCLFIYLFISLSIIKGVPRREEYMSDLLLTLCDAAELAHHYHPPFLSSICYFLWPTFPYFSDSITIGQIFSWTFTNIYLSSISYDEYFHIGILRKMRFSQIYILRMWGESGLNFLCKISAHIVIGLDLPSLFPFFISLFSYNQLENINNDANCRY